MCIVPIGMAEVSTCELIVKEGQIILKGEQLGMFHYGGSTFCTLFRKEARLQWMPEADVNLMQGGVKERKNIPVNSEITRLII